MTSSESPPPSPILSHATRREAIHRQGRIQRSSSASNHRVSKDHGGSPNRDLARMLLYEEREAKDLRRMLLTITEQLRQESHRADENERRAKEAIFRFKAVEEARATAQAEAAKANEELRMYKLQLETAQREINKAQEILDSVEDQRYEAEASAARARTTARKLKEQRLIDLAREEGRRIGMQEGISRGRRVGFENGRVAGFEQGRSTNGGRAMFLSDELDDTALYEPDADLEDPPLTPIDPIEEPMLNFPTPRPTAPPDPVPERISPPRSRTSSRAPSVMTQEPPPAAVPSPSSGIHPTVTHNIASPVRHPQNFIPPEGYIPRADPDSMIRLPPPHEMQRAPPTPESVLRRIPEEGSPLMIPNPSSRPYPSEASSVRRDFPHRRPVSPESQGSTTISQFELVSEPSMTRPSRNRPLSTGLSVIQEVSSGYPSPANGARSLAGDTPSRPPSTARGSPLPVMMPVTTPTPQPFNVNIANLEEQSRHIYRRPSYSSSSESTSQKHGSASRTPAGSDNRSLRSLNNRASSSIPDITIQPPSRPSSQTPQATPAVAHGDFLSAEDAANRPIQPPEPEPVQPSPRSMEPETAASPLPNGELPPGFIPMGPPVSAPTPSQSLHTMSAYTGVGVPLPPSATSSFYQLPSEPGSRAGRGMSSVSGMSGGQPTSRSRRSRHGGSTSDPVMVPLPPTVASSSIVLPPPDLLSQPHGDSTSSTSTTSEDEAVRSSIASSSGDTLTTPPIRNRKSLSKARSPAYDAAPIPTGVEYPATPSVRNSTPGNAARVPLPPSTTAGTPRTTSVFTPHRSGVNINAGMTPGVRHSSLRSGGREPKVHHRHSYKRFDSNAYLDPAYLASSDDLHETDDSSR